MEALRVISTTTVQAQRNFNNGDSPQMIDLNPWDLQFLMLEYAQKGLLYHKPTSSSETVIQRLKDSLSSALNFYPPLAGRLAIIGNDDDGDTSSVFITCNNAGVSFVHAIAENTTVADIVEPTYVPLILYSFFPAGNFKNFEGTRVPLLAIQVTELVDGIFIASSTNHCLAEVKPGWDFWNTWAEIFRNGLNHLGLVSKLSTFERWFPHGIDIERPIRIPFKEILENHNKASIDSVQPTVLCRRIFRFKKEKIAELKAKARSEVEDSVIRNKISSLQAVIGHVWGSTIRNQNLDPEEEVTYRFHISARSRVSHPPIPKDYFGITVQFTTVVMKVRDLVGDRGLGKFASEMTKAISSCTEEKIKRDFEGWVQNPTMRTQRATIGKFMSTSSSPRTNFFEIDFGWGRPTAGRFGPANTRAWMLAVDGGAEEGSFEFELCASYEILEAMARDPEFMRMVSPPVAAPNRAMQ
ncbi:hypothetical protein QN277_029064 [Acacia crassicarpa]|uniref:Uncharacterized protein n=1 Tax=Acacia crassicarpa TaxID=499986 RepID=A0AAE1MKH2_9FABA|nr:hypothetical protein QN277_029064 [Acacia crassicarpa]